jgi:hypothetical protein
LQKPWIPWEKQEICKSGFFGSSDFNDLGFTKIWKSKLLFGGIVGYQEAIAEKIWKFEIPGKIGSTPVLSSLPGLPPAPFSARVAWRASRPTQEDDTGCGGKAGMSRK